MPKLAQEYHITSHAALSRRRQLKDPRLNKRSNNGVDDFSVHELLLLLPV